MSEGAGNARALVVAHHHPGRLRVRSRAFEREPGMLEATEQRLSQHPGVLAVHVHGATGSVLVAYDPERTDAGALLSEIAVRANLFMAEEARPDPLAQRVYDALSALDDGMYALSEGRFGLGLVLPIGLAIGSVGSFLWSTHRRMPRWDSLLYWAVQFFRVLNEDMHPRRRHAAGV